MKTSIIIPFKNEKEYVNITLPTVYHHLTQYDFDFELVIIDDSTDGSWDYIRSFKHKYENIIISKGRKPTGYGSAIKTGIELSSGDIIITFNGDLSDDIDDIITLTDIIKEGYDMAFGSRYMRGSLNYNQSIFKKWISILANRFLQLLFNTNCNDLTNSFKAYHKNVIHQISPSSNGYEIVLELVLKALIANFSHKTIPITWTDRSYGESKMSILKTIPRYIKIALKLKL